MGVRSARRAALLLFPLASLPLAVPAQDGALNARMQAVLAARPAQPRPLAPMHATPCVNGLAGGSNQTVALPASDTSPV